MTLSFRKLMLLTAAMFVFAVSAFAQKTPAYKITDIRLVPYDGATGEFQAPLTDAEPRSFFNDLSISMLVQVEVTGEAGSFVPGRKVDITVMEGKKVKKKMIDQIGLIGGGGKFYIPLWLDSSMCDEIKVTAKIVSGKTIGPAVVRKVPFMCGE